MELKRNGFDCHTKCKTQPFLRLRVFRSVCGNKNGDRLKNPCPSETKRMAKNMDVSVIIPVYNPGEYLERCLSSTVAQNGVAFEVICVDDASTDGSWNVIERFSKTSAHVVAVALDENGGQAHARNIGMGKARGKYLYFLDSDDELVNDNALLCLYEEAERTGADCVCFDSVVEYEREELKPLFSFKERLYEKMEGGSYGGRQYFESVFWGDLPVHVWRQFWNKQFLISNGVRFCEDTSPHEDILFTFEAFYLTKKVTYMPETFHRHRYHKNCSSLGGPDFKRFRAHQKVYIESLRFLEGHSDREVTVETEKCVQQYLRYCLMPIYQNYARLVLEGYEVMCCNTCPCSVENLRRDWIIMQRFPLLERIFTTQEIGLIKNAGRVIVYGAGKYAIQLRQMLLDFGIDKYEVCVSKKQSGETEISEMKEFCETGVVILAASPVYRGAMRDMVLSLGFSHIIDLGADPGCGTDKKCDF